MQISGSLQSRPGTCAHRGAGILGNEINAQPSDDGVGVVFVQTVKGEAVVEPSRHLEEHLTSDQVILAASAAGSSDRVQGQGSGDPGKEP